MDAGARGRRLLQRREYKAKVSEFVPKELEDQVVYENPNTNLFGDKTSERIINTINSTSKKLKDFDKNKLGGMINKVFGNKGGSNYTPGGKVPVTNSFEPEGDVVEANSAQQKAMQDAKIKRMEDEKVSKKTKKEDVQLEGKEEGGYISNAAKAEVRNLRRFGKKGSATPTGRFGQGTSEKAKLAVKRGEEHKARRGVKTKKEEVQLEVKKSCGEGEYYCYDEQKCKPIPDGMKVGKDGMLVSEDMKGMSQKSGDKRSTESGAGMTAKGVAKYNRRTGGNLKTAVTTPPSKLKAGSKAAGRRKSFCARSKSWTGPRGKAARRRWNCSYEPELPMIIDEKKLYNGSPLSDRVAAWAKKINEGDSYVKSDRNKFGLPKDLKSVEKKVDKKVTGVNYGAMAQSYVPQGEMIERKMTSSEKDRKEKYVKGMKKDKGGFTKRYGKDGKSVMYATATKMAMKKEETLVEKPGDGYIGPTMGKVGIPNPIRIAKDAADQMNRANLKKVNTINKISPNSASMPNFKQFNPTTSAAYKNLLQSHEPEGEMTEAKYEKGASDYGKTSIRNKRAFGKGGNAAPPKERGGAKMIRLDLHKKRRGVKKNNKYGATNKPPVDGAPSDQFKKNKNVSEGSLHKWFSGSKSKDGKGGWVNVKTGGTCASDEPGEGTPKCVSSSKRASMTKAERDSASRRKKAADPNQQSKSGAAKPTYVATDKKKKK